MPPKHVRLVPNLSITALQYKLDKELCMWYSLRAINYWGSGRLELQSAVYALKLWFHYPKSSAYRILDSGNGVFWKIQPSRDINRLQIQIQSLKQVAEYLNTDCDRNFVEITVHDFVGDGKNRVARQRGCLYSTFHPPLGAKALPISRASITEATGVNRRTQQRYDRYAVERTANFANNQDVDGRIIPILELVDGKSRQWPIHKRLGNTYHCRGYRSRAGMLQKVNAALGRFFMTGRSYFKYPRRQEDPYLMPCWSAQSLWCAVINL